MASLFHGSIMRVSFMILNLFGLFASIDGGYYSELRLVGGTSSYSGLVEVNIGGGWGTICDRGFHDNDAKVICRQLGLPHKEAIEYNKFSPGTGDIIIADLGCIGSEMNIDYCSKTQNPSSCTHNDDVGVICTNHEDFENDDLRTYDGEMDGAESSQRVFRIQEGAIVKFICSPRHAGGRNTLNNNHARMQWELGGNSVYSDNIPGVNLDQYVQMYQSNGRGFNGRKGKRISAMVYTARMEDNFKEIDCNFFDEDSHDSVIVDGRQENLYLLVLPGPEPLTFKTTVTEYVWAGGFAGKIHIPINDYYNSWKIVLRFPKKVLRLYGGNFNIAPEPCLDLGSCERRKKTWIIYNTYENRVLSPIKDLSLTFIADVRKTLRNGRGRGLVADVKFYGFNKVFGTDYEPLSEDLEPLVPFENP